MSELRKAQLLSEEEYYADVEYYFRNAAGEWETAKLEGDDLLGIDCGAYRASLGLIDLYEDVVFPD